MVCGMPLGHVALYFLSVAASNIASPNQSSVVTLDEAVRNYIVVLPHIINNTYYFPGLSIGLWHGIADRTIRSTGLLLIAASFAIVGGVWLGRTVSRTLNTQMPQWFVVMSSTSNTLQSLFVASSGVAIMYFIMVYTPYNPPLPIHGFGWDAHLVLPILSLTIRPLMSIAHDTATLFGQASQQPHVIATQARGFSNAHIIRNHLWPAQQMTIGLMSAANIRQMIAELMVVEMVFGWEGVGEAIVRSIIPPAMTSAPPVALYLDAPTFASLGVVVFGWFACIEIIRLLLTPAHVWALDEQHT